MLKINTLRCGFCEIINKAYIKFGKGVKRCFGEKQAHNSQTQHGTVVKRKPDACRL